MLLAQGNGHERDKLHFEDEDTFILDAYNSDIWPNDRKAKTAIDEEVQPKLPFWGLIPCMQQLCCKYYTVCHYVRHADRSSLNADDLPVSHFRQGVPASARRCAGACVRAIHSRLGALQRRDRYPRQ